MATERQDELLEGAFGAITRHNAMLSHPRKFIPIKDVVLLIGNSNLIKVVVRRGSSSLKLQPSDGKEPIP